MGIRDRLELQQREQNEQQQILEVLSDFHGRLDGIEMNQKEVVSTTNASTQSIIRIWTELEQMRQLMQPRPHSGASVNESVGKTLKTLANTQKEILEVLSGSGARLLPGGSTISAYDISADAWTQSLAEQIQDVTRTSLRLADEIHRKRTVDIDYEKLATYLVPRLSVEMASQEKAVRMAWADAAAPVLDELKTSRAALRETGAQIDTDVKRFNDQIRKLRRTFTWHEVGQIGAALLPFTLAITVVFGVAQTVWAAFGFRPILQTIWASFAAAEVWYWKLAIAGAAFGSLTVLGWLTCWLGKKVYLFYKRS